MYVDLAFYFNITKQIGGYGLVHISSAILKSRAEPISCQYCLARQQFLHHGIFSYLLGIHFKSLSSLQWYNKCRVCLGARSIGCGMQSVAQPETSWQMPSLLQVDKDKTRDLQSIADISVRGNGASANRLRSQFKQVLRDR